MNYSRDIKKVSIFKRIVISWLIIMLMFFIIGFSCGWGCKTVTSKQTKYLDINLKEVLIFEQPDRRIFKVRKPVKWQCKEVNFVPLDVPMNEDLQEYIFDLSAAYGIDFTFVMALIQQESSYNPNVISQTNDYGLMQINKINHPYLKEELGISDFLNPYDNIRAGMFILRELFEKYKNPNKVLMAYNMGESGASRLWKQGIFEIDCSKSVLEIQSELNVELKKNSSNVLG